MAKLEVSKEDVEAMKELIKEGDINLDERKQTFKKLHGRDTTATDAGVIAAIAATTDDDDEEFVTNLLMAEEGVVITEDEDEEA